MDINKTIIHVDAAGGKTFEDVLNSNVGKRVKGTVHDGIFTAKGMSTSDDSGVSSEMTFDDFVDVVLPTPDLKSLPNDVERREAMKQVTNKRRVLRATFTKPGQPGEAFAALVEQQRAALTKPSGSLWNITPTFFYLMNQLSICEWPFVLIFRTFGSDLLAVLDEWREFVRGRLDVRPEGPLLRAMAEQQDGTNEIPVGSIYRDTQGLSFCWGVASPPPPPSQEALHLLGKQYLATIETHAAAIDVTYEQLFAELTKPSHGPVVGAVDYYPFWSQHGERRVAGKVYPVLRPRGASAGAPPFQVFFDDNIAIGDEQSIVDLRDAETGHPINDHAEEAKYCCAVDSFEAICNVEYFAQQLAARILAQSPI